MTETMERPAPPAPVEEAAPPSTAVDEEEEDEVFDIEAEDEAEDEEEAQEAEAGNRYVIAMEAVHHYVGYADLTVLLALFGRDP